MSLYDDFDDGLDITKSNDADNSAKKEPANSWTNNTSFKFLQNQVEAARKRQQSQQASSQFKREKLNASLGVPLTPVIDLSDKRKSLQDANASGNQPSPLVVKRDSELNTSSKKPSTETRNSSLLGKVDRDDSTSLSIFGGIREEYDPMKPNDYEQLVEELIKMNSRKKTSASSGRTDDIRSSRQRGNASDDENRKRGNSSNDREYSRDRDKDRNRNDYRRSSGRHHGKGRSSDEDDDRDRSSRRRSDGNHRHHHLHHDSSKRPHGEERRQASAAFAPPPSLIEADSQPTAEPMQEPINPRPMKTLFGGLLKAEKMMAKMGYKEGEGLGRNKQGMSMALQVEKTGKRSGRIIHEKDAPPEPPPAPISTPTTPSASSSAPVVGISPEVMKNMSKVILLRNMVGPGDVDDDLEAETKEECQKYGEVNKVVIFEIPGQVPEEAVRIFVEFKTLPSAIKALTDLNGRFFGGRVVKATFYNVDKFSKLELGEDA